MEKLIYFPFQTLYCCLFLTVGLESHLAVSTKHLDLLIPEYQNVPQWTFLV